MTFVTGCCPRRLSSKAWRSLGGRHMPTCKHRRYSAFVTSYWSIQNELRWGRCIGLASGSPSSVPIKNSPAGISTIPSGGRTLFSASFFNSSCCAAMSCSFTLVIAPELSSPGAGSWGWLGWGRGMGARRASALGCPAAASGADEAVGSWMRTVSIRTVVRAIWRIIFSEFFFDFFSPLPIAAKLKSGILARSGVA